MLYICILLWLRTSQETCFGGDLGVVTQVQSLRVAWQYSVSYSGNRTPALFSYFILSHSIGISFLRTKICDLKILACDVQPQRMDLMVQTWVVWLIDMGFNAVYCGALMCVRMN